MSVELAGAEALDELRPLWLALRRHHGEVAPDSGRLRSEEESWASRRAAYARWLADGDAFVAIARDDDDPAAPARGYAFVNLVPNGATWGEPARIGMVESLVVDPEARGGGHGLALMRAVWDEVAERGGDEVRLTVLAGNAPGVAFYERIGMTPFEHVMRARRRP
ncbi:MAG TPA: GNAT family N-acetyltransferase [Capillimicrobium sp.]